MFERQIEKQALALRQHDVEAALERGPRHRARTLVAGERCGPAAVEVARQLVQ